MKATVVVETPPVVSVKTLQVTFSLEEVAWLREVIGKTPYSRFAESLYAALERVAP